MSIKYPSQLDNVSNLPNVTNGSSTVDATLVNDIKNAVIAIEAELRYKT